MKLHLTIITSALIAALALAEDKPAEKKPAEQKAPETWQRDIKVFKAQLAAEVGVAAGGPPSTDKLKMIGPRSAVQKVAAKYAGKTIDWRVKCTGTGEKGPVIQEFVDNGKINPDVPAPVRVVVGQSPADAHAWKAVKPNDLVRCEATIQVNVVPQKTSWLALVTIHGVKTTILPPQTFVPGTGESPGAPATPKP